MNWFGLRSSASKDPSRLSFEQRHKERARDTEKSYVLVKTLKHLGTENPAGQEEAVSPKTKLLLENMSR